MKIKKLVAVSMLALTVVSACTAAPMAAYVHNNSYSYEDAAEAYADDIEALVENTGDSYEKLTEGYPSDPNSAAYVQSAVSYGKSFLSSLGKLTGGFLGKGK